MTGPQASNAAPKGPRILIGLLVLVILVQFGVIWSLLRQPAPVAVEQTEQTAGPSAGQSARVVETAMSPNRRQILVSFDQPVGPKEPVVLAEDAPIPASVDPEVAGRFAWASPFMLRFEADQAFSPAVNYALKLDPAALGVDIVGETTFNVASDGLRLERITLDQEPAEKPNQVRVKASLSFNLPVRPEDLDKALSLHDPLTNASVPLMLTTTWISTSFDVLSDPVDKTPEARELTLSLAQGLPPAEGDIGLDQAASRNIELVLDPALHVQSFSAQTGRSPGDTLVSIRLSAPVTGDVAARALTIKPDARPKITASGQELSVRGDFQPGQTYSLTLAKGLTAADGAVLEEDAGQTLRFPDLEPRVGFRDQGMFLSREGMRSLTLESVNARRATLRVDRVYLNNLFNLLYFNRWNVFSEYYYGSYIDHVYGDNIVDRVINLQSPRNSVVETPLELGPSIRQGGPGLYHVGVSLPDDYEGVQRWALVTDLGLTAKLSANDILVSVASLKNQAPRNNVRVELISDQNQVMLRGSTDANGLWHAVDLAPLFEKHRPYLLVARVGSDFSFLLFDEFGVDTAGLPTNGRSVAGQPYTAYLYGERNIYRPGETVKGLITIRDQNLKTPPPMPVTLICRDPQGRELSTKVLGLDERGMVEFRQPLADFALTGRYGMELRVADNTAGTYEFMVEDFMPDRIEVGIDPATKEASLGQNVAFDVSSRYFFGPPARDLPVETRVRLEAAEFSPQGWQDYVFGESDRAFDAREVLSAESRLDDSGRATFEAVLPDGLRPAAALAAAITCRVRESGGRGVAAMARVPVHAYPYYLGLKKLASQGVDPGLTQRFDYAAVAPDGQAAPSGRLMARFYEDRWQTVLRRTPSGALSYDSVRDSRLLQETALPAGDSAGSFAFTPPSYGAYRVVLEDPVTGAAASIQFYAGGWGYSPWAMENPARLDLVLNKDEYRVGEMARVQVRAPFAGRLLVTVENDRVRDVQVHELSGNTAQLNVPLRADYSPNVYVTAVLVRGADSLAPGEPARAMGAVPVFVGRDAGRLPLAISAPAERRPLETLDVEVQAQPGGVVTLAAVDEGILQLIAQQTPDPFALFYEKRQLEVTTSDIFSLLFPEPPRVTKALAGGDAFLDKLRQLVRTQGLTRVKPVAFWSGPRVAGADGKVHISFELPQFQGALRLMAVGADGPRFGSTQATVRVRSPLVALPTFPRFLAFGDSIDIPIALRNDTGADGDFAMTLAAQGPASPATQNASLSVAEGRQELAFFPLTAGETEGRLGLTVTAQGRGEQTREEAELPVRAALPASTTIRGGVLAEQPVKLPMPEGLVPGTSFRDIVVGSHPLISFSGNLKSLLAYPHGCLEQTVSRAFPLLYLEDLARAVAPDVLAGRDPAAMVQAGVSRVMSMQLPDGGFSLWPRGDWVHVWASLYATHFLLEASRSGYYVDQGSLDRALQFAGQKAREEGRDIHELRERAYALYILAQAGWAERGAMDALTRRADKLPADVRDLLAAAWSATGQLDTAQKLLAAPGEEVGQRNDPSFDSAIRRQSLYLSALLDAGQAGTPAADEAAAALARQLEATRWPSTQENAFAFMALGKHLRRGQTPAPYLGRVLLDGRELATFDDTQILRVTNLREPGELTLEMTGGAGRAHYSVLTRGAPLAENYKPSSNGLEIRREYLSRDGAPLDGPAAQGDLLVLKIGVRSPEGPLDNVVVQNLLPAGLEIENPRLATTERLSAMAAMDDEMLTPAYQDLRDDRVLFFADLDGGGKWRTMYSLVRAVSPGRFQVPPARAEAMYHPELRASGERGELIVERAP